VLKSVCNEKGAILIEDISQAIGVFVNGMHTGGAGTAAALSFYPTKNLGCFGDGGMILTNDDSLAELYRYMRNYGQREIYSAKMFGINSRLDDMQALILNIKLKKLDNKNSRRREIMKMYKEGIENPFVSLPEERYFDTSNGHIFPLFSGKRDKLIQHLIKNEIGYSIHYPYPLHRQSFFRREEIYENSEILSNEELSIPNFPEMTEGEVEQVINTINGAHLE